VPKSKHDNIKKQIHRQINIKSKQSRKKNSKVLFLYFKKKNIKNFPPAGLKLLTRFMYVINYVKSFFFKFLIILHIAYVINIHF